MFHPAWPDTLKTYVSQVAAYTDHFSAFGTSSLSFPEDLGIIPWVTMDLSCRTPGDERY